MGLAPCIAWSFTLKGHVNDGKTGEPLTGASVRLLHTGFEDISGLDGSFQIKDIPEGTYKLSISYLSFETYVRTVVITRGGTQTLDVQLQPDHGARLQAVTVSASPGSGQAVWDGGIAGGQLKDVISARAIRVSPDLTVADAMQRVSGVALERSSSGEAEYAVIRGMDKRYNYTMINGVKIPSPTSNYRYLPLDIFPSGLLGSLRVYKTLTPVMEADATGGAVDMVMKSAPSHLTGTANLAMGYSEIVADRKFMGFDYSGVGSRSPYEQKGSQYNATASDFSPAALNYRNFRPGPDVLGGFSVGDRFFHERLGVMIAGSMQRTYRGNNSLFFNSQVVDTLKGVTLVSGNERRFSTRQTRYGLYVNLDYQFDSSNVIRWNNIWISLDNMQVRDTKTTLLTTGGYDPQQGSASLQYSTRSRITAQHIFLSTLEGAHQLSGALKLQWSLVGSLAAQDQPDNSLITLNGTQQDFVSNRTSIRDLSRRWEFNSDDNVAAYLNFSYNKAVAGIPVTWKAGGLYRYKRRVNSYNEYFLQPADPFALYGKDFDNYTQIQWNVEDPRGSVASPLNYNASEYTEAGYLQFHLETGKLAATGGVRAEYVKQGYRMRFPVGEQRPRGRQVHTDLFPSLNLHYYQGEGAEISASYFRSVNRPGFFEIVPYTIVNEEYVERGNPDLKESLADNWDLRYTHHSGHDNQIMAGFFYKHIHNAIEYSLQPDSIRGQDIYDTPGNFGNATNLGVEVGITRYFHKVGVKANYTYTYSRITTPKSMRIRDESDNLKTISVPERRPLYNQPAHIWNLAWLYKDASRGWESQLVGAYSSRRIFTVSQFAGDDIWQHSSVQLDASLEKKIGKGWSLFVKMRNLLNTPMVLYIDNSNDKNAGIPHQDLPGKTLIRRDYFRRSMVMGIRYTPRQ